MHHNKKLTFFDFQVDDTRKWRQELNSLAKKIGIVTTEEISAVTSSTKPDPMDLKAVIKASYEPLKTSSNTLGSGNKLPSPSKSHRRKTVQVESDSKEERVKTSRFNEKTTTSKKVSSTRSTRNGPKTLQSRNLILCAEEAEREIWVCIFIK